jgi:sugar phosphate isomerase/epimerase
MLKLSAFADEISPNLDEQIRACRQHGISHFELRSVQNCNVLDFDAAQRRDIRSALRDADLGVICIASPIGKVKITDPWPAHFDRFKIAVGAAEFFGAPFIRLFSYYPPGPGQDLAPFRDEIVDRMQQKAQLAKQHNLILVHENEKDIYGEKGKACLDLLHSVNSPHFRCAFDFANFVQAGERPLDNWPSLKPYTVHIHVKDALRSNGSVVPAGRGDGDIPAILTDAYRSGYRGFLSLEPHLAAHGQFSGFSGPALFGTAVAALREVCAAADIPIAAAT